LRALLAGRLHPTRGPTTVFNISKQASEPEYVKVFSNVDAAEKWFEENDPEGVAFEYEVLE
jgi:hypothetical protein